MLKENNNSCHLLRDVTYLRDVMRLPLQATVSDNCNIVVDVMRDDQLSSMYEMISQAMRLGEGFGVDEFPSESDFLKEINGGPSFVVLHEETKKIIGGFSLAHSKYYRGTEKKVADPIIIVKKSERRRGIGEFIFKTVVQFATLMDYAGIYTDTFGNNLAMRKIIERKPGFQKVGYLPVGGKMPDGSVVGMFLYYKDLRIMDNNSIIAD